MPSSLSANCPTCKATIGEDDRTCARCGADVSVWPDTGRTPLILPGNPALSADMFRGKVLPRRVITGALIGCVVLFGGLYIASEDTEGAWEDQTAMLALRADAIADSVKLASALAPSSALSAARVDSTLEAIPTVVPVVVPEIMAVVPPAAAPTIATPAATPVASNLPGSTLATPVRQLPPALATATAIAPAIAPAAGLERRARAVATVVPLLRLVPLVSDSLRAGQLLQLRWSVQDRATGKAVPATVEFTSTDASIAFVDRRTGTVSARRPGSVRVIADAGAIGRTMVALTVYAPIAPTVAVAVARTEPLQARTEAARSSRVVERAPAVTTPVNPPASTSASTPVAAAPRVVAPSVAAQTPAQTPAQAPSPALAAPARETRRSEVPDAGDVRTAVDRLVSEVRRGGSRTFELIQFFGDGADHRVTLLDTPTTIGTTGTSVRVTFQMRLYKYDGGGRPTTRLASVSMDVDKRDAVVTSSAVAISPLRKQ